MALVESQVLANEIERVNDIVPTLFEREDTFFSSIEKRADVEVVSSRDFKVPLELRTGGNFGGYDPDGGDLGLGDGPTFDKGTVPQVHMRLAIQWTKKSEWATDDKRKAVLNTFRYLLAKGMAEFRRHLDSQCMTDGTGVLGTIGSTSNAGGFDTVVLNTDGYGARLLRYGQTINYYNAALSTNRTVGAEKKITFYDSAAKTIKTATTAGLIATDKVVVGGVSATPPAWLYGVPYHHSGASTGTWMGLDRALNPEIRGNQVAAGGTLALPFARLAMNKAGDRIGQDQMGKAVAWMHPAIKQSYEEMAQAVQVINRNGSNRQGVDLYFNEDDMRIAGVPIRTHFSWDKTRIDFIVADAWGRAEMHPLSFYEVDGRKIFELRGASGGVATSQIFYLVYSWQLFMRNPVAGAFISGLTPPAGY